MGAEDWLVELRALRAGEGPAARRYRARWWGVRRHRWIWEPQVLTAARLVDEPPDVTVEDGALRAVTEAMAPVERVDVGLFPLHAEPGDLPLVVVPVAQAAAVASIAPGATIAARGVPEPGHALVLEVDGRDVPCIGPAWIPTFFRKRRAL